MVNKEKKPYGYIYVAENKNNGKKYVGQTVTNSWKSYQNPIEERWKREIKEAYNKLDNDRNQRYIEQSIVKHGPENFTLKEIDTAENQLELNQKENKWMKEYDTLNPDKGYNLMEAGKGGQLTEMLKDKMSNAGKEKWQNDKEYRDKQVKERQERAKDSNWTEKMTEINRERAKTTEYQKKLSEAGKEAWKNPEYQKRVSKGVKNKWQDPEYVEKQRIAKKQGRREIEDKKQFLEDIKDMKKKDINEKYNMDGKSINKRIEGMLGEQGVKNYSQARDYLKDKDINDVLKDVEKGHQETLDKYKNENLREVEEKTKLDNQATNLSNTQEQAEQNKPVMDNNSEKDYKDINKEIDKDKKDYQGINESTEKNTKNDYIGVNEKPNVKEKDYDGLKKEEKKQEGDFTHNAIQEAEQERKIADEIAEKFAESEQNSKDTKKNEGFIDGEIEEIEKPSREDFADSGNQNNNSEGEEEEEGGESKFQEKVNVEADEITGGTGGFSEF